MTIELAALKVRRSAAMSERGTWSNVYQDVYDYCCPYRRPAGNAKGQRRTDHLFDNTAIVSTFRGAGQLQQDIFPPGQVFFNLKPGPIAKSLAKVGHNGGPPLDDQGNADPSQPVKDLQWFERELDNLSDQITPLFLTGEWDNAVSEMCIDLYVGTGVMLILEGDDDNPVRFVCIPIDEAALEPGAYGDVGALYWRTLMSRRSIFSAFPKGSFPSDFMDKLAENENQEIYIDQDFVRDGKEWVFVASIEECGDGPPISMQTYKTQPFIASRFYRVPGEVNGRGPALLALPTAKTLNKAMELSLKNYAIQMLGLWGYRPGGTFDPSTSPIKPGGFWPMSSTGGINGADVTRLDVGGGASSMGNIVLQDLRNQVQTSLHDEQLPPGGNTPKSAAEIMGRLQRMKQNYVGAYGRMIHEVIPVAIRRVMEIAFKRNLITSQIALDQLLVTIDVISPIAQALKADHYRTLVEAMQLVAQLEGPQAVARRFKVDTLLPEMIRDLGIDSNEVRTVQELAVYDKNMQASQQAQQVQQAMLAQPDKFASAINPTPDQQAA